MHNGVYCIRNQIYTWNGNILSDPPMQFLFLCIDSLCTVRWNACAQTNTSTWQVDWTFRFDHKTWKDANISCRSLGGSLATVETMAQLQCANSTAKGTSATWVGLTGTWGGGNWIAWKWEAALSSVTAQLPWSLQFPLIRTDYVYGYYQPDKIRLGNWDKKQSLRYLCQRYVPKGRCMAFDKPNLLSHC